ncbi:hypothetical protein EV182_001363 [Spiromyces aspiralis]|uniref:Uncharacterized protein n=1 Tax=Spiromyces aspiralis TaxID=68401 RepID=A0ACC1HIC1_9FUNG|nr:hypothetical protein EV182_001363 [Spiromyces aspiralis]
MLPRFVTGRPRLLQRISAVTAASIHARLQSPSQWGTRREYKVDVGNLRPGQVIDYEGKPLIVLKKDHGGTGRGQAVIKVEFKHAITGQRIQHRLKSGSSTEVMQLRQQEHQLLYISGKEAHLMDMETFEELVLPVDSLEGGTEKLPFVVDGMNVIVQVLDPEPGPISWRLPSRYTYTVESVENRVAHSKGATYVPAKINGGATVMVPDFINAGENIIVDTSEMCYQGRA